MCWLTILTLYPIFKKYLQIWSGWPPSSGINLAIISIDTPPTLRNLSSDLLIARQATFVSPSLPVSARAKDRLRWILIIYNNILTAHILFSDAPYFVRGVSINQDVCLCVCARHFHFGKINICQNLSRWIWTRFVRNQVSNLSTKYTSSFPI